MVLLYKFVVDGVDITNYVVLGTKITLSKNNTSGNTATVIVSSNVTDVYTPNIGDAITISRGIITSTDNNRFKGNVKVINMDSNNNFIFRCKDALQQLKYNLFTYSYDINIDSELGEGSAIFSDIVTNGGFTPSVVSSGTTISDITFTKFISKKQSRLNRMNLISTILNWVFYYDYDEDWVRLEPKGYTQYPTTLVVGTNIVNILKWNQNLEGMRNNITVEGAFILDTRNSTTIGDGVTKTFSLAYTPDTTDLSVDGVLQVRGAPESAGDYDYTVDAEQKTYTFIVAPPNADSVIMNYTTRIPMPVNAKSSSSINQYGLEQAEVYTFDDVVNITDAESRAQQLVEILKDAAVNTIIQTTELNIYPGMGVIVEDPLHPEKNGEYIVYSVTMNYPNEHDSVEIGSAKFDVQDLFRTIDERLQNLENKDSKLSEILRSLINIYHDITFTRSNITGEKRDKGDSFIFDDPDSEFDDGVHLFDWDGDAYSEFVNTDY